MTVMGVASAIKDIFEIISKLMNGQLNLAGGDGQKILKIASQILGFTVPAATTGSSGNIASSQPAQQQQASAPAANTGSDYQFGPTIPEQQAAQQPAQQQPVQQQQYGYQPQQQQAGYQQQQATSGYSQQQSTGAYGTGRGVDGKTDDRGILQDIGNFVKTEIQDMATGTDSNGINISNLLTSGIDSNNLREAATPLITDSFKKLMESAESNITDLITDGVINGVKSYLNINTKVKDIAGSGLSDLGSLKNLFSGSNESLSRDAEASDRQVKIFGIFSKKVNEGLDAIRSKNRELIHNEVVKVENTIWEQLPSSLKAPLESSVRSVMSDKGTLTRGFDLSTVLTPIVGALAEPAEQSLKELYDNSHRGIEDSIAKMAEDAIVSRVKKYIPFVEFSDDKKN